LPAAAFPLLFTSIWFGERTILSILGSLSALYLIGLLTIGCYLVVRTSYRYGHLTLRQGVVLSLAPVTFFMIANFSGPLVESLGEGGAVGVFALGMVGFTAAVGASLYRYETFQSTPAVGRIGERVIVRQTEDLMFVVDEEERVIRLNRTAADRLDVSKTGALGEELSEVIGASIDDVEGMETIELLTDEGSRQFDPVISRLTDQHDRELGHTLSLHDVTELELREQRLEVLNRVLRHNLRNQIEVIKSNAEVLADETADGYADSIIESADRLTELGRSARSIDQIVSQPSTTGDVDVAALVREIAENARTQNGVELSLSVPEEAMVVTERHALVAATESAIKNALSRADTEVRVTLEPIEPGHCLTVVDDGPGIPDEEIETISAGTETPLQHATGLGLWQLKWAVTKFNGELSIDNDGRTTVELRVPDQDR
jgi:signal transduction histidine kinase